MGIIKSAADLVYTFRFLKLLVTKFENTEAYKAGIIDKKGNKNKNFDMSTIANRNAYSNYYTPFIRLVFNIKKALALVPGGSSTIGSFAAALYLLREQYGVSEDNILKGVSSLGLDSTDVLVEQSQWFILEDSRLSPGTYRVRHDKVLNKTLDEMVRAKDSIIVPDKCYPIGNLFGINIYEVTHFKTKQKIYVSAGELLP